MGRPDFQIIRGIERAVKPCHVPGIKSSRQFLRFPLQFCDQPGQTGETVLEEDK